MAYVYQQQEKPTNFTGVQVALNVVDANGNYRTIGTTTTDSTGFYSFVWTPDIEGKYTVYATFAGTNGYWGSAATTAFNVDPAAATPTPQCQHKHHPQLTYTSYQQSSASSLLSLLSAQS